MKDYVCLVNRFPAAGIEGVLGLPVDSEAEIATYRSCILPEGSPQGVQFVRLTAIPESAKNHLKPGDIVVKYDGLSEKFLDVLRKVETATMVSKYKTKPIDWEHAEDVRAKSLATGTWQLSSDRYQVAISDPDGRLAVLRAKKGTPRRLFPAAYTILLETEHDKKLASYDPYIERKVGVAHKQRCAWATMRFIHQYLFKHGPDVDSSGLYLFKKRIRVHNRAMLGVPDQEFGRYMRLHTRRTDKLAQNFWRRVRRQYIEDPESLPSSLAFVASKRVVRWVRLEDDEIEKILNYVEWEEWSDLRDPMHFSNSLGNNKPCPRWN